MSKVGTVGAFIAILFLHRSALVQPRPPAVFYPHIYDNIEMRIEARSVRDVTSVGDQISSLEKRIMKQVKKIQDGWARDSIAADDQEEVNAMYDWGLNNFRDIYVRGEDGTPPRVYDRWASAYGLLLWLREWRDVGYAPEASFSLSWHNSRDPSQVYRSQGFTRIYSELPVVQGLPQNVTYAGPSSNATRSVKKIKTNGANIMVDHLNVSVDAMMALGALPPDPWLLDIEREYGHLYVQMAEFGARRIPIQDMYDVTIDCLMQNIFDREFPGKGIEGAEAEQVTHQPLICGQPGGPQIFLDGNIEPGMSDPYLCWFQVEDMLEAIFDFIKAYRDQKKRWIPSVAHLTVQFELDPDEEGGEHETVAHAEGWWGMPEGIQAVSDRAPSNTTHTTTTSTSSNLVQVY